MVWEEKWQVFDEANRDFYSQNYPFEGLLNYTSGIIHHVKIDDLEPGTKYYYKCGDSSLNAMSEEHEFETLSVPGPNNYPRRIAVIGDLGLALNSTTTINHVIQNDPFCWRLELCKSIPYNWWQRRSLLFMCIP